MSTPSAFAQAILDAEWIKAHTETSRCCATAQAVAGKHFGDQAPAMLPAVLIAVSLARLSNEIAGVRDQLDSIAQHDIACTLQSAADFYRSFEKGPHHVE